MNTYTYCPIVWIIYSKPSMTYVWNADQRLRILKCGFLSAGMYSPSGGEARIDGHSISSELNVARQSLGLCPQHNMLFSDLTVYEHFMIFAMVGFIYLAAVLRLNQILRLNSKLVQYFASLAKPSRLGVLFVSKHCSEFDFRLLLWPLRWTITWLPHVWQVGDCKAAKPLESQKWRLPSVLLGTPAICILHQCECYFNTKRAFPDQGPVVEGIKIASQPVHGKPRTWSQSKHQFLKTLR